MSTITKWQHAILKLKKINPFDSIRKSDALAGHSKHNRQRVKPKNWRAKRKTRQLMSKASRRRNRGQR